MTWRWPAALLVDTPHGPVAALDGEVLPILVDPGTESGRAELERHHKPSLLGIRLPYCSAFRYYGADMKRGHHEIAGRQAFDFPSGPQDKRESRG
jgi:hypothetical protein